MHDFRPKPETEIRQVDKVVPVQQLSNDFSRQPERQTKKRTPQCDREDSESDDVSERRRQKGQAETDIKAGTTQHSPSKKSKSASQNVRHRTADRTSRHKKRRLTSTTGSTSTEGERRDRKSSTAKEDEPYPPSDAGVDSSSEEEVVPPKHMMKPPKFDGLCSFETFMVQFSNCADYNKWTEAQKLAHLRNSLEKDVANILWDYGTETTTSWRGLTEILETRFGGKAMSKKYRLELRHRRRLADETLQSLHSDVRRLAALAYNGMTPEIRDPVTCDHFLDALGDPELAFKIRERQPADVDSALRIALRLEVLAKELTRDQDTEKGEERRVRAISNRKPRTSNGGTYVNSYRRPEATRYIASSAYSGPRPASYNNRAKSVRPPNGNGNRNGNFYRASNSNRGRFNCGDLTHRARNCPIPPVEQRRPEQQATSSPRPPERQQPDTRPVKDHSNEQVKTSIWVKYRQRKLSALIDTGSDVSIAGEDIACNLGWTIHAHRTKEVSVANDDVMLISGVA